MSSTSQHIGKSVAYLSGSNSLQRGISFVTFFILVKYLSLFEYGVLTLLLSFIGPVLAIATLGLGGIVGTEISLARGKENFSRIKSLLKEYVLLNTGVLILAGVLFWFLSDALIARGIISSEHVIFVGPLIVLILLQIALNHINMLFNSYERFRGLAFIGGVEAFIRLIAILAFFYFFELTIVTALLGYIVGKFATVLVSVTPFWRIIRNVIKQGGATAPTLLKIIKGYGKWTIINNILGQFRESVRFWLVGLFINAEGIAVFGVASKMVSMVTKFFPLQQVIQPLIARRRDETQFISFIIKKARKYYILYFGVAIVGIWLFIEPALSSVFPQYAADSLLFKLLSLRLIVDAFTIGQTALLYAYLRQKFLLFQFIFTFIVGNIINAIVLYFFGLLGLALGIIASVIIGFILREVYIQKKLPVSLSGIKSYITFDSYDRALLQIVFKKLRIPYEFSRK